VRDRRDDRDPDGGQTVVMSRVADAPARAGHRTNRQRVVYWAATSIVCAVMVFSIVTFTFHDRFPFPNGKETAFAHLGLPGYFKVELTVAKTFGVLALLIPSVPPRIKEFAYFGFGITLLSAAIAHYAVGDANLGIYYIFDPLFFLGLLIVSYIYK
jgi:hypothetical protein